MVIIVIFSHIIISIIYSILTTEIVLIVKSTFTSDLLYRKLPPSTDFAQIKN